MRKTKELFIFGSLLFTFLVYNFTVSIFFVKAHGFLLVNDGYFNYAVFFRNKIFQLDEPFEIVEQSSFFEFPIKLRILYPLILALISGITNSSIEIANYIFCFILNIFIIISLFFVFRKEIATPNKTLTNFQINSKIVFIIGVIITTPVFSVFSFKFSTDLLFSTLLFYSVYFFIKFISENKFSYWFFTFFFTLLSLLTKELAIYLFLLYFYYLIGFFIPSIKKRLLLIFSSLLILFVIFFKLISSAYAQYYIWLRFLDNAFLLNDVDFSYKFSMFIKAIYFMTFKWLFLPLNLYNLLTSLFMNFVGLIVFLIAYYFFRYNYKFELIGKLVKSSDKHLGSKQLFNIKTFLTQTFSNKTKEIMVVNVLFYFLLLYATQASYLSERYFLPISFSIYYLVFRSSNSDYIFSKRYILFFLIFFNTIATFIRLLVIYI